MSMQKQEAGKNNPIDKIIKQITDEKWNVKNTVSEGIRALYNNLQGDIERLKQGDIERLKQVLDKIIDDIKAKNDHSRKKQSFIDLLEEAKKYLLDDVITDVDTWDKKIEHLKTILDSYEHYCAYIKIDFGKTPVDHQNAELRYADTIANYYHKTKEIRKAIVEKKISPVKIRITQKRNERENGLENELENDNIKSDSHYSAKENIKKLFIALLTEAEKKLVVKYDEDGDEIYDSLSLDDKIELVEKILDSYDLFLQFSSGSDSNKLADLFAKLHEISNLCDKTTNEWKLIGEAATILILWAACTAVVLYFFVPLAMLVALPCSTGFIIFSANSLPSVLTWSLAMTGACLTIYASTVTETSLLSKSNALQKALHFLDPSNDTGKEEGLEMTKRNQQRL